MRYSIENGITYSPAEKARRTRDRNKAERAASLIRSRAEAVRVAIDRLSAEHGAACFAMIPAIFAALPYPPAERYDAFQILDEKPGQFPGYMSGTWHMYLRQCRNHPIHGRELFAAINAR